MGFTSIKQADQQSREEGLGYRTEEKGVHTVMAVPQAVGKAWSGVRELQEVQL